MSKALGVLETWMLTYHLRLSMSRTQFIWLGTSLPSLSLRPLLHYPDVPVCRSFALIVPLVCTTAKQNRIFLMDNPSSWNGHQYVTTGSCRFGLDNWVPGLSGF